jgi:hypothetical protein
LLQSVFGLSKQLGKIPFSMLVKQSTGFDVIPINDECYSDKVLIDTLQSILKKFLKTSTSTHSRYEGSRINEVGRRIEEIVVNEMNKPPLLTVRRLGKTGYPDMEISHLQRITYLEMKTSCIKEERSTFRYFYYSNVDKIKAKASHLLLNVSVTQESPGYWKVNSWILSDLSKLNVSLKNEFNASKRDLMDESSRIIDSK